MATTRDIMTMTLAIVGVAAIAERGAIAAATQVSNNIDSKIGTPSVNLNRSTEGIVIVSLPISITNNNSFSIKIDNFKGRVFYGDTYLSDLNIGRPLLLEANKHTKLTLTFAADINRAMTDVVSNFINDGLSTLLGRLYLKGELEVFSGSFFGSLRIPVDTTIPIV